LPLSPESLSSIFEGNVRRVYGRLSKQLEIQLA
jgi:hypothetical protein